MISRMSLVQIIGPRDTFWQAVDAIQEVGVLHVEEVPLVEFGESGFLHRTQLSEDKRRARDSYRELVGLLDEDVVRHIPKTMLNRLRRSPEVAEAYRKWDDETAEAIWNRLDDPKCAEIPIVAVIDDQVVGFAGLRIVPNIFYPGAHAEITELFVEEQHRRQGIASALMRYAEEIAQSRSAKEIVLHTGEDNQAARKFYAAMGYEEWELVLGRELTNV